MKSYKVILLNAEKGYKLYNKTSNVICTSVQLPIDTDITIWKEITDEEAAKIVKHKEETYQLSTANGHFASIEKEQ